MAKYLIIPKGFIERWWLVGRPELEQNLHEIAPTEGGDETVHMVGPAANQQSAAMILLVLQFFPLRQQREIWDRR